MVKETIHRKLWKDGKLHWEVRGENGRFITSRNVAGSGLTKSTAATIFKNNNTLHEDRTKRKLGRRSVENFYEETIRTNVKTDYDFQNPPKEITKAQERDIRKRIKNNEAVTDEEKNNLIVPFHKQRDFVPRKPRTQTYTDKEGNKKRRTSQLVISAVLNNGKGKRYFGRSVAKGSRVGGVTYSKVSQLQEQAWENLQGAIARDSEGHNSGDTIFGNEMIETYGLVDVRYEWVNYYK